MHQNGNVINGVEFQEQNENNDILDIDTEPDNNEILNDSNHAFRIIPGNNL